MSDEGRGGVKSTGLSWDVGLWSDLVRAGIIWALVMGTMYAVFGYGP